MRSTCSFFTFFFGTGSTLFSDSERLRTDRRCCFLSGITHTEDVFVDQTYTAKDIWISLSKGVCVTHKYLWTALLKRAQRSPGHSSLRETQLAPLHWNTSLLLLYHWSPIVEEIEIFFLSTNDCLSEKVQFLLKQHVWRVSAEP